MASSSWNYDVFVSFRGEDTRRTFVAHLYDALVRREIKTYIDENSLNRGESIGPSVMKAIKGSRIAVVVFSENYADSAWCLDELVKIIECKKERGLIVMPVFYDVEPSQVRYPTGKFGEAFAKHESRYSSKILERWKKALWEADNLAGLEPKNVAHGHEYFFIELIVEEISTRLPNLNYSNEEFIGIETRVKDFIKHLEINAGGVQMVGICGLGGAGKTTLAFSVYEELSRKFDCSSFVRSVGGKSRKFGLLKLQERVLFDTLKLEEVVKSKVDGIHLITSNLNRKRVLLVLDDVDDIEQLKALAGSPVGFGEGSRIIITTRDEHLLVFCRVNEIYRIKLLNEEEALQLFSRLAFGTDITYPPYEMLARDVVCHCEGRPLDLKILGSFLCDKDMNEWEITLTRLKKTSTYQIVEIVEVCFNQLDFEDKEIFLDIACFYRWFPVDYVMQRLDACGFHARTRIRSLLRKSLIIILEGKIDMHDVVQELGHYIVQKEKNPENRSRVWLDEDVLHVCMMGSPKEDMITIEAFCLASGNRLNVDMIPRMHRLRLLDVPGSLVVARPPQFLSNELRLISWEGYPESLELPTNFYGPWLRSLILPSSGLTQLWTGYMVLAFLKELNLTGSKNLIRTPDFGGLPHLERLDLSGCSNLTEIHPSIGYHKELVFLDLRRCSMLERFPPIVQMKKLESLLLKGCRELLEFQEIQENTDKLVRSLESLKTLDLCGCSSLEKLPGNGLSLGGHLEKLDLSRTSNLLQELDTQFQSFIWLRELNLSYCNLLDEDIPSSIDKLSNLQILNLQGNNFSRLHSSISLLPGLKCLNLSVCEQLVELPDLPSSIAILEVECCNSLESTTGLLTNCRWLWYVSFLQCPKLHTQVIESMLKSMCQGNAIENGHLFILKFDGYEIPSEFLPCKVAGNTFIINLPPSWSINFSGFSFYVVLEWFGNGDTCVKMGYVPCNLLEQTTWWQFTSDMSSLSFTCEYMCAQYKVVRCGFGLVSRTTDKITNRIETVPAEFWDKGYADYAHEDDRDVVFLKVEGFTDPDAKFGLNIYFDGLKLKLADVKS